MGIARCEFHLENREEALESVWELVAEKDCLNGDHPDAAFLYAELAAKAGQINNARRLSRRLPWSRRGRFLVSVAIWEAYEENDPHAVLDALDFFGPDDLRGSGRHLPFEFHGAARVLRELGPMAGAGERQAFYRTNAGFPRWW